MKTCNTYNKDVCTGVVNGVGARCEACYVSHIEDNGPGSQAYNLGLVHVTHDSLPITQEELDRQIQREADKLDDAYESYLDDQMHSYLR